MGRLDGKVALITGAAQGIGKGTALLFAQEGARVAVVDIDAANGERTVEEIRAAGGDAAFFEHDVGDEAHIRQMVADTVGRYGRLDVLYNNAYRTGGDAPVVEVDPAYWNQAIGVLVTAVYLGCKFAIPEMVKNGGGSIITTSSVHGLLAAGRSAAYETGKAAVINLMRQVAVDYGRQGIRANAICPGWIITERGEQTVREDPHALDEAREIYPVGFPGRPIDIAYAALYLASDESRFVTGHALVVDGGMTCQLQDNLLDRAMPYFQRRFSSDR